VRRRNYIQMVELTCWHIHVLSASVFIKTCCIAFDWRFIQEGALFITSLVFFVWCQVSTSVSGLIRKEWRKVLPVIRSALHTQVPNQWRSRKDALLLKTLPSSKLYFDIGRISLLEIWNFFTGLLLTWQV